MHPLARETAALLNRTVSNARTLHGGDLSEVLRVGFADGSTAIVKNGPAPQVEAAMLRAIRATGAPAPKVLACSETALVLEDLPESGGFSPAAWSDLGRHLKTLHRSTGTRYGWDSDYAFAHLPIRNTPCDDWPAFWARNRLLPELPHLPRTLRTDIERIADALPDHLASAPPASLLHGDLWTGNVMIDGSKVSALIDPACYHGDAEVDLAMLEVFGAPAPAFWESYGYPPGNWPVRRAIYQLWPAIVHIRLFGAGYFSMAQRLIAQIPA